MYEAIVNKLHAETDITNSTIIVAVSGGPDSMGLLYILNTLKKVNSLKVVCAHVNHAIRSESDDEALFLEKYCLEHDIIFEYMKINSYGEDNFHSEARAKRYAFFEDILKKYNSKYLFTAHHADDLVESILMRLTRGSSLRGYAGFSYKTKRDNYKIIRPLIDYTKDEILAFNRDNKILYVNDESNNSDNYTRNRYRKNVVAFLKKEDVNVHKKFKKFSELIFSYDAFFNNITSDILKKVYIDGEINIDILLRQDKIIVKRVINYILELVYDYDLALISDVHTDTIIEALCNKKPNIKIYLPNDYLFIKEYRKAYITKSEVISDYDVEMTDCVCLSNGFRLEKLSSSDDSSNYTCRLNSEEISLPIRVRSKKDGDKMVVKNMVGSKKVKDIFISEKVPLEKRGSWPIVVDSKDNILWIPGLKKSKFDKQKKDFYDILIKYY